MFWILGTRVGFFFPGGLRWVIESGVSKTGWSYRDGVGRDRTSRI